MTTGDEPMLPQPSDDSPMISSVLTRVIADARGAYLAGNLKVLWDHMMPEQQLRFRQELMRQVLYYADQLIDARTEHQLVWACIEAARAWLGDPSDPHYRAVEIAYDAVQVFYRRHRMPPVERWALSVASVVMGQPRHWIKNIYEVSTSVELLYADGDYLRADFDLALSAARRWQVETAWSILTKRPIPAFDAFRGRSLE
jgi:hypothetical protein